MSGDITVPSVDCSVLGSNSTALGKPKLAPRSSLQFKVGPQFTSSVSQLPIFNACGKELIPKITPRIDRGFERIAGDWIGYKRNYFTLVCAFHFENHEFSKFVGDTYHTIDPLTSERKEIGYFGLRLISKCADDESSVALVQHTAKRDRGPQFPPPIYPVVPSQLPNHEIIRNAANVRNISKIAKLDQVFFYDKMEAENSRGGMAGLFYYPEDRIAKVARYERIQFSSSINYKKQSSNSKKFKLYVELVGSINETEFITLAFTETPPLIVRGRSPSNYRHLESSEVPAVSNSTIVEDSSITKESKSPKPRSPLHDTSNIMFSSKKSASYKSTVDKPLTSKSSSHRPPIQSPTHQSPKRSPKSLKKSPKKKCRRQKKVTKLNTTKNSKMTDTLSKFPNLLGDKSLDDQDTYEILFHANKELDELAASNSWRLVATSTPSLKTTKGTRNKKHTAALNSLFKRLEKPKLPRKPKCLKEGMDSSCSESKAFKDKRKPPASKVNKLKRTLEASSKDQKVHFPSPSEFELENFDFDSSIGDVELMDARAKRSLSLIQYFRNQTISRSENEDNQDKEMLLIKSKVESIRQNDSELNDLFSQLHESNPSEILNNEFDDGPSFVY